MPVWKEVTREHQVRVPVWREVEEEYTVKVPVWSEVEENYTVNVPQKKTLTREVQLRVLFTSRLSNPMRYVFP